MVEIIAELIHETEQAYLIDDGDREVWIPKSQVEYQEADLFMIPEWLAIEKELI
jgi:gentisate 1,2-dioxygenase